MFTDMSKLKIYLKPGCTDMRKSINGLSGIVLESMSSDPLNGNLYLFVNRRRNIIKCLYWQDNGFCLWQKRLEKHRFPWLRENVSAKEITLEELTWLLKGIDFFSQHKKLKYSLTV